MAKSVFSTNLSALVCWISPVSFSHWLRWSIRFTRFLGAWRPHFQNGYLTLSALSSGQYPTISKAVHLFFNILGVACSAFILIQSSGAMIFLFPVPRSALVYRAGLSVCNLASKPNEIVDPIGGCISVGDHIGFKPFEWCLVSHVKGWGGNPANWHVQSIGPELANQNLLWWTPAEGWHPSRLLDREFLVLGSPTRLPDKCHSVCEAAAPKSP